MDFTNEDKGKMLGSFKPTEPTYDNVVDIKKLKLPLKENEVARYFCTGCGATIPITWKGVELLSRRGTIVIPSRDEIRSKYFEVQRCLSCGDDFRAPVLRDIG